MHVAVIGAGALGRVFGVLLADAGQRVTFVVRPSRADETTPFVIERRNGDRRRRQIRSPVRAIDIPQDAALALLAVRVDQLDDSIEGLIRRGPAVPLVSLTPLLPLTLQRVSEWTSGRCFVAMPSLAASARADGTDDYWAFRLSPSLFEPGAPEVAGLVQALVDSKLPVRLAPDVRTRNPALTMAFFPITVAVSRAGGIDELLRDAPLAELGARATRETLQLAREVGPIDTAVAMALRALTPRTLRGAFLLLVRLFPRATRFVDTHFGDKLGDQHRRIGAEILELGEQHGIELPSLGRLLST
jgi:2-dehydropantoate 2-reductase